MSTFLETVPKKPKKKKDYKISPQSEMSLFLETVPKKTKAPKPTRHEMSIFIETVPKEPQKQRLQNFSEIGNELISRDSHKKTKDTKTHRPRSEHIHRDSPKKTEKPKIQSYPKSHFSRQLQWLGIFFLFFLGLSRRICSFRGLWALVFLVFLGLSRRIHLRAASMKPKSLQNSVSKRGTVVESFFCQLSSQLGSHFWSLGLSIGARKTISKGSLGL